MNLKLFTVILLIAEIKFAIVLYRYIQYLIRLFLTFVACLVSPILVLFHESQHEATKKSYDKSFGIVTDSVGSSGYLNSNRNENDVT